MDSVINKKGLNMKKMKSIIGSVATFILAALSITSCVDKNDWEVDSSHDRLFSITKMSVSASTTDAEFTFTANSKADYYIIELSKDSLYDAIEMGEHASSLVYGEDKSITKSPVTLDNLDSDSKYYLRVKAMSANANIESSNWSYLTDYFFNTRAEQIISNIIVGVNDVTIEWPAGSSATHITISNGSTTDSRDLTSEELAEGKATVTGLDSETTYTIKLLNGETTRGSRTFTTLMDLGGATPINPDDDIAAILAAAEEGDIYAIMSGTYVVDAKIELSKTISVRAAIPGQAVINGMSFNLKAGAGLELKDLTLDGTNATGQLINYPEEYATETAALVVSGCDIQNYESGFINQRVVIEVNSMNITGNLFNKIGGRFIDIQAGYAKTINLTNNTIANSISGDAIRIDNSAGFTGITSIITISNNTFYKVCNSAADNRLIYTRLSGHSIKLSKNLVTNSIGIYSNQSSTNVTEMTNNYYHNAPNYYDASIRVSDANGTVLDPEFVNPDELDFTVQSNAIISAGVGDPRWLN